MSGNRKDFVKKSIRELEPKSIGLNVAMSGLGLTVHLQCLALMSPNFNKSTRFLNTGNPMSNHDYGHGTLEFGYRANDD